MRDPKLSFIGREVDSLGRLADADLCDPPHSLSCLALARLDGGDGFRPGVWSVKLARAARDHDHMRACLSGAHNPIHASGDRIVTRDGPASLDRKVDLAVRFSDSVRTD